MLVKKERERKTHEKTRQREVTVNIRVNTGGGWLRRSWYAPNSEIHPLAVESLLPQPLDDQHLWYGHCEYFLSFSPRISSILLQCKMNSLSARPTSHASMID
jgi:hypothetical protein